MSTDRQIAKVRSAAAVVRLGLEQLLAEAKDITNPAVRVEILRLLHPANTPQDGIIDPLRDLVAELAGQPSWELLPVRMEQLRRGVQPKAQRTLMTPDAELAAEILDPCAGARQHRRAGGPPRRPPVRPRAWSQGIEHTVQLHALADTSSLAAAGWEPVLLAAIDRGLGYGGCSSGGPYGTYC
ncbi:hypothetical protein [Streptomyces sp. CFMR 7]|uniref:hypothetical protein n=1 Tax=Streptomyces sp. CFMR 7 TaxID=1649184 RepID=UPI0011A620FD|nr:hypothetical protein [Streptomyces sp. CFMR 7]